ncbi:MAG: flagella basal body P-ring formation protein FlgA [Opitutia bacterium Tous-C1TDCM]|nr:MAG: flagella basal body P-ring formation protein FlgA [Opitutae bacterium Tous-C1TDCM]
MKTPRLLFLRLALALLAAAPAAAAPVASEQLDPAAGAVPFTRDQLVAALTRKLAEQFTLDGDLQLELIRPWASPARVAKNWDLQVLEFPSVPAASMMVRCRIFADAVAIAEATFVVRAQLWRDAWVSRQPLVAGTTFDAAMLETRRVDLFRDRDVLPAAVGDRSYIFARAVAAGRLMTWRDISRRPLVKKGDLVEVSAVDGLLAVTMKALAMENGAQGDTVTVRNPESRKDFAAMVIDENRVQVRF